MNIREKNNEKIRVLLVESDSEFSGIVEDTINAIEKPDFHIDISTTIDEAVVLLSNNSFDIIFLGIENYDDSTLEKFHKLYDDANDAGIVIISDDKSEEFGELLLSEGAQDYVLKNYINKRMLSRVISYSKQRSDLIKEIKKKGEQLSESEQKYREIVENAKTAIVKLDLQGNITFFNEFSEKLFGYPQEEIIGKNIIGTLVSMEDVKMRAGMDIAVDTIVEAEKKPYGETLNQRKNGEKIWVSWTNKPIISRKNEIVGILAVGSDIREHKRNEQLYYEANEKLLSIISSMDDIVFVLDKHGGFVDYFQTGAVRRLPTKREKLIGKHYRKTDLSEEMIQKLDEAIDAVIRTDEVQSFEYSSFQDDSIQYYSAKVSAIKNFYGQFEGITVVSRNVSEQMKLQESLSNKVEEIERKDNMLEQVAGMSNQLIESGDYRQMLPSIIEEISSMINADIGALFELEKDENGKSKNVIPRFKHKKGEQHVGSLLNGKLEFSEETMRWIENLSSSRYIAQPVNFFPGDMRGHMEKMGVRSALLIPIFVKMSLWGMLVFGSKNEKRRYEMEMISVLQIAAAGLGASIGNNLYRKLEKAQMEAKRSSMLYEGIYNSAPLALVLTDKELNVINWNNGAVNIFGITKEEAYGKRLTQLLSQDMEMELSKKKSIDEIPGFFVQSSLDKKGETHVCEWQNTKLIDGANEMLLAIGRDISDQMRAEEEKKKQQQMLIQTDKLVGLGQLSAGIAHEISQPLSAIVMTADDISIKSSSSESSVTTDHIIKSMDDIIKYSDRIRKIIEHVRLFSREQDNVMEHEFCLNEAALNAVSLVNMQYKNKNIDLDIELKDGLSKIVGNSYRFEQVVLNLLTNSKDAIFERESNEGSSSSYKKRIALISSEDEDFVYFSIEDNGCGISKDMLGSIFNPFFTTKPVDKGTGLGLSISYGIIKEMNGDVEIESKPNEYTGIKLKFPKR